MQYIVPAGELCCAATLRLIAGFLLMDNIGFPTLESWAGSTKPTLVLLFTDIVDSTAIGKKLGDNRWINELAVHFQRGRLLAAINDGYVIKVIGDAFMIAFRNATNAVDFAVDFSLNTGVPFVGVRIGIHSGQVQIMENDIYGLNVNCAARIQTSITRQGISVSEQVKRDYEQVVGTDNELRFQPGLTDLKNFGKTTLWRVRSKRLILAQKQIDDELRNIVPAAKPVVETSKPTTAPKLTLKPRDATNPGLITSELLRSIGDLCTSKKNK